MGAPGRRDDWGRDWARALHPSNTKKLHGHVVAALGGFGVLFFIVGMASCVGAL